jgi:hypothetical protein
MDCHSPTIEKGLWKELESPEERILIFKLSVRILVALPAIQMRHLITITLLGIYSYAQVQGSQMDIKIDLSGRHLKSIPDSIFEKREITYLDLGSHEVTFYPPLSALVDSNVNEISKLPDKVGELTNLRVLILNSNKLTALPNSIMKLTNLEVLDLSINKELDIIQELNKLKQLPKLKVLKIVDVKRNKNDLELLKKSLNPDTKVIVTIKEYMETLK